MAMLPNTWGTPCCTMTHRRGRIRHRSSSPEPQRGMISYISGDLFETPAQTMVNTVNTVGVMGKGVALRFKKIYPEMFKAYRELCEQGELQIGRLFLYRTQHKLILNFPTKEHWRRPSRPEYIAAGLRTFVRNYERMGILSVAFPPLGCGNGELDFAGTVKPMMEEALRDLPIPVYIYAPKVRQEPPEHRQADAIAQWLRNTPSELSFEEVWSDITQLFSEAQTLETLAGRGTTFEAHFVADNVEEAKRPGDGVRVRTGSNSVFLHREEFHETWNRIRSSGLFATRSALGNRERAGSYLLPVLARLPYVRVVEIGSDLEALNYTPVIALQLAPAGMPVRSETAQLELV